MNKLEKKMVEHLLNASEKYGVTGLKVKFETETTRLEEAMRFKEITTQAGLAFIPDQKKEMEFYINMETQTAIENFEKMSVTRS